MCCAGISSTHCVLQCSSVQGSTTLEQDTCCALVPAIPCLENKGVVLWWHYSWWCVNFEFLSVMCVCVGSASELILVVGCKSLCVSLTWTAVGGAFQFVAASQILDHVITILLQTAVDSVLRPAVMLRSIVFLHSLISLYNYWCAVHNRQPFS